MTHISINYAKNANDPLVAVVTYGDHVLDVQVWNKNGKTWYEVYHRIRSKAGALEWFSSESPQFNDLDLAICGAASLIVAAEDDIEFSGTTPCIVDAPVPFSGTTEEKNNNFATHNFFIAEPSEVPRCLQCDSRFGSISSDYSCNARIPRHTFISVRAARSKEEVPSASQ